MVCVKVDSFWQNSPDYYVGPFATRKAAEAAVDEAIASGAKITRPGQIAGDVRAGVRLLGIVPASRVPKRALRLREMPRDITDLNDAVEAEM